MDIPQSAIDLILESEGMDQPYKWPGGGSGITLGYGVDIGADPEGLEHWRGVLADTEIQTLRQAVGVTGRAAQNIQSRFVGIKVSRSQALKVFQELTLPTEIRKTLKAFPGVEFMPPEVLGAMVSLVYNRGTSIEGDRRREMRIIHEILAEFQTFTEEQRDACRVEYMTKIAGQFRRMKRLWIGQSLDGLLVRRDKEADLILSAI